MAQLLRGILATLAATTVIVTAEGNALADPSIATADGRVDLTNVGVIHSYVHEKVPAGTTVTIETVNLAVSPATVDYLDTIVHVFDRDTRQHVATNDDCGSAYSSCLTLPADSNVRSYVIYVHAYSHYTHGMAELRISHNGTAQVETQPFSFGGIRVWTGVSLPTDSLLFTTGYSSAPLGTRLIALNSSSTPQALDDNDGAMGFSNLHLPATLPSGGSFVVGAHGGLMSGGPPDTAGVSLHWKSNMSYMMPFQKKVEDTAYEILREAAQAPDGRWFTAFAQAFGGRINYNQALAIKNDILQGVRYPVALQLVAPSVLVGSQGQALGAYGVNKIFLSTALTDEYTAGNIFIEEIGHYFDKTIGGTGDAPGDEGHMFWSYIVGESLTAAELANLKALDDTGTICTSVNQCFAVEFIGVPSWLSKFGGTLYGGLKTGGGWVWGKATTVGGAIQTAANAAWDGSEVLTGWIAQGALDGANACAASFERAGYAGYNQVKAAVDLVHDLGLGVYDGAKIMEEGVADIARGNIIDGVTKLYVGMAKLAVEAPLSAYTAYVLSGVSSLQILVGLEPIGRPYTPEEYAYINWVFWYNNGWWSDKVLIKEGFCGIYSIVSPRPFTVKSNIYLKDAVTWATATKRRELTIHESTHVWQWWNGGSDYILDSVYYQGRHYVVGGPDPYLWQPSVDSGTQWSSLQAEHQASFVESAYGSSCYDFSGCTIGGTNYDTYFGDVDYHITNGLGAP